MTLVIDTNILCLAARDLSLPHITVLTLVTLNRHRIALDFEGVILTEYYDNLSRYPLFQKWYRELCSRSLIMFHSGRLAASTESALRSRGLHQTEDLVIVALALKSSRLIVTEDSDFGKGPSPRARDHSQVSQYLRGTLGITLVDAAEVLPFIS